MRSGGAERGAGEHGKRDAEARSRVRDEHLFIPIHYQVRPWAMKKNVDTVHRSDDKPVAWWARIK